MSKSIDDDEHIQFFRTAAVFDTDQRQWTIPIHGWVYGPQQSRFRKIIFAQALKWKYGLGVNDANKEFFDRRLNLLIADNERNKVVNIELAKKIFTLPISAPNGHFSVNLIVEEDLIERYRQGEFIDYSAVSADGRKFIGQVTLLENEGLSVISDIDDTIKVSEVLDHQKLVDNSFLKVFLAVEGMSEAYRRLASKKVSFHYVSSSPWQLYAPLQEFVDGEGFPWATFSLKAIRFRDMTLFDLFKPGTATKPLQIESILAQYPQRRFFLIGDSGEQDPEVYGSIAAQYPDRIEHIYIRNVSGERLTNERFSRLVSNPSLWTLFDDPAEIKFL